VNARTQGVTRRLALASVGAAAALVAGLALPAQAAAPSYVALGDSYSSGLGTRSYVDDGTGCQRSTQAYPALVAASRGYTLDFRACSGATVPDVVGTQLGALSSSTALVTISVGGNDAGFAAVLTECAQPGWMSDCDEAIDGAQGVITGQLPGSLDALYAEIAARAPSAQVEVVGYPRLFMGEDCNAFTWFSPEEQSRLNATADLANSTIAAAASRAGFGFADPTSAFTGHAVCDDPEWVNGLSNPISESFHPNVAGHRDGYTPLVGGAFPGAAVEVTPATVAAAAASADELAARNAPYAALDAQVEPKRFVLPDLTTPQAKAAAARAGVDLTDRTSIDAADRRASTAQAAARTASGS
jgi:lysophospholipase L1-like esterase